MNWRIIVSLSWSMLAGACVVDDVTRQSKTLALPYELTSDVLTGAVGAIVVDHRFQECETFSVRFVEMRSGKSYELTLRTYVNNETTVMPSLFVVPAGTYVFSNGICRFYGASWSNGYATYAQMSVKSYRQLGLWLKPIEVKSGEVVYPGTVIEKPLQYEYGVALLDRERITGRKNRSTETVATYIVVDDLVAAQAGLALSNPELASRMVNKVTLARLDSAEIKQIADAAFALEASEIPPDDTTAYRNRDAALARTHKGILAKFDESVAAEYGAEPPRTIVALRPRPELAPVETPPAQ